MPVTRIMPLAIVLVLCFNFRILQLVENRRTQKENEEHFTRTITEWSNTVTINFQSLDQCDITEIQTILQTQTAIELLEVGTLLMF